MNEKDWCSTLGGSFAVIRTVRPVPGRKLYERLSSLSHPPGALSFRFLPRLLARSYISHCGFEIIFMFRRQRPPRSTYIYIFARGSAVSCERAFHSALNYAISRILLIARALPVDHY